LKPVLLAIDNLVFMSSCIEYALKLAIAGADLQSAFFGQGFSIPYLIDEKKFRFAPLPEIARGYFFGDL